MKKYLIYALMAVVGIIFYGSAAIKLSGSADAIKMFEVLGLADWRLFIAGLEIACITLFLVPQTKAVGTLLMSSYLGGAMVAHLSHGQLPFIPTAILGVVWLVAYLRKPGLFTSDGLLARRTEAVGPDSFRASVVANGSTD